MTELSELEMRILSELNEAGQDPVQTLLVTVFDPINDQNLEELQQALSNLVRLDLVRLSTSRGPSHRLEPLSADDSMAAISTLPSIFALDGSGVWTDVTQTGPPYGDAFPYVLDTDAGEAKGREILEQRDERWWLQSAP